MDKNKLKLLAKQGYSIIPCSESKVPIGQWKKYQETLSTVKVTARSNLITNDIEDLKDETAEFKALNEVGVVRYCCRRHLLAHTDIIDIL